MTSNSRININLALDHVVIVVNDLTKAKERFHRLGFTVVSGGVNDQTHNALIFLEDGSYVELLSTVSPWLRRGLRALRFLGFVNLFLKFNPPAMRRYIQWLSLPEAIVDICLKGEAIHDLTSRLITAGYSTPEPMKFKRTKPDGQIAKWHLTGPLDTTLPFFIDDITDRNIRVPYCDNFYHKNTVTGIHSIQVSNDHFKKVGDYLSALESGDSAQPDSSVTQWWLESNHQLKSSDISLKLITNTGHLYLTPSAKTLQYKQKV